MFDTEVGGGGGIKLAGSKVVYIYLNSWVLANLYRQSI